MRKYSAVSAFFLLVTSVHAQNFVNGQAARAVFGQTNFTAGSNSPSQQILGAASGLAYANGILYVADSTRVAATPNNSRIMAFQTAYVPNVHANLGKAGLTNSDCYLCGFPAFLSLGQSTFTPSDTTTGFATQRTQNGMANATGVATDGHYFAVADTDNNRVLLWNEIPTQMDQNADLVLGQTSFTAFATPTSSFASASSLRGPQGVWIQNGKLFVADTQNNRVLIWNSWPTQNNQPADLVLGQSSFNSNTAPAAAQTNPPATAAELLNPASVTSDGTRLFVADLGFNRVLIWNTIPTTMDQSADVAVGQPDMVSTTANNPVVCGGYAIGPTNAQCQTSLNYPRVALSTGTKLFIADGGNDRVLVWNTIPTTNGQPADVVLGEPDFLQDVVSSSNDSLISTAVDNTGGVDLLPTPQGLAWDGTNLYISDAYNRRVLVYTPGDTLLDQNSVLNWASEIIRQEGIVTFSKASSTATITANDTVTVTIAGTAYKYTIVKGDTVDTIAQAEVKLINATDTNVTAIFAGTGTGTIYLSSKSTALSYDALSLAATASDTSNEAVAVSGDYLSSGTAATGAAGMLVEIDGTNLSDQTVSATLDGKTTVPNALGGVQVYMDGYACPIFKASPTQIVTQIPYPYDDRNSTSVYVRTTHNDGSVTVTNPRAMYVSLANPGIFNAPSYSGQPRPWPISLAYHQPGNATSVVSIDGAVTAGNSASITIAGVQYSYTAVSTDTTTTVAQNLANKINASDQNVTASLGGQFARVVLTAKKAGSAGNGITVTATVASSTSTTATLSATAYTSTTCCLVTPGSLITTSNPAGAGELITVTGVGLGGISDSTGTAGSRLGTGVPYAGPTPNTVTNSVSAIIGGTTTAQVIDAGLPADSYGTYQVQLIVPQDQAANNSTQLNIAQNVFISNTVLLPVGTTTLVTTGTTATAPATNIREVIDAPAAKSTVSGTILTSGWALNTSYSISNVTVSVDGNMYGTATRGNSRSDVCAAYKTSPDCPGVGWSLYLDTTQFADGQHTISITATGVDGLSYTVSQVFNVANGGTAAYVPFHANVDVPSANQIYRGTVSFSGWALNSALAINSVNIYIDGASAGTATYGSSRPDVCAIYTGTGCPAVGWSFPYDTTRLYDGQHTLEARAISASGSSYTLAQSFQVQNWTGAQTTHAVIDAPSVGAGAYSGTLGIGGWALDLRTTIVSVDISVDGVSYGAAQYGGQRTDVCAAYKNNPGCPDVGFNASLDTTQLSDGAHTLTVTVTPLSGQSATFTRAFTVINSGTAANPILAIIDQPANGASVSGAFTASGWGLSKNATVASVKLSIDGTSYGTATSTPRSDVCALYPSSPSCPNVGWTASLNSSQLSNGTHILEATVTSTTGERATVGRIFSVANSSTGPGKISFDNPGPGSNTFLGSQLFSGWALNNNSTLAVSSLSVTIDGIPYGTPTYGLPRADVCAIYPLSLNCPGVGWSIPVDTTQLVDGKHTFAVTMNNADGSFYTSSIQFTVANYSTANPMIINIDAPVPSTTTAIFGSIGISGWAVERTVAITAVTVAIDGVSVGTATYGTARADVCSALGGFPGCPNVGFAFNYQTTLLSNGIHLLSVTGTTASGQSSTVSQYFEVAN